MLGLYNSPDVIKFSFLLSGFSSPALKANASVERVGPKKIMRKIQVAPSKFIFRHLSSPLFLFFWGGEKVLGGRVHLVSLQKFL